MQAGTGAYPPMSLPQAAKPSWVVVMKAIRAQEVQGSGLVFVSIR